MHPLCVAPCSVIALDADVLQAQTDLALPCPDVQSPHCMCRCSTYTACLAATSICASATAAPTATPDAAAPVITVRAPASNSVTATGYVITTVYVGMPWHGLLMQGVSCVSI